MEEIRAFYDAVLPRLDEMIRYLEDFRDGDIPELRAASISSRCRWWRSPIWWGFTSGEYLEACDPLRYVPQRRVTMAGREPWLSRALHW